MNLKKQHWTLYFITATIVLTIAVQLYWNYNNYSENKQRVQNEIQSSLDIAIEFHSVLFVYFLSNYCNSNIIEPQ